MDFDAIADQVVYHCKAAAASLANPITDVAFAHPLPKGQRCIRVYYDGETEPSRLGTPRVLNAETVAEKLVIVAFWVMSSGSETLSATVESEVRALKHAIRTRILADSQLNDLCEDLDLGYAVAQFEVINGAATRTLQFDLTLDWEEYPIAR